jgi:aminomethyltransferase
VNTATAGLPGTLLFEEHVALGAKMAPFAGFMMPIHYGSTLREHEAARSAAAVFDTSHMGEFRINGPSAKDDLERLLSCDIASIPEGRCRYGLLCNDEGGVLDDLLVYRLAPDSFMLVVNAGTRSRDFAWIRDRASGTTTLVDESDRTAKVDLQGPASPRMLRDMLAGSVADFGFYSFRSSVFDGSPVLVSRTGYTGEIGFEIYGDMDTIRRFWRSCLDRGAVPAGLGARDTLRLEMGMPLYGHELSENRNAAESGFTRSISPTKHFIGSEAIRACPSGSSLLTGIGMEGRRAARAGDAVLLPDGSKIGSVTSGSFAPSLGRAVAMAYVDRAWAGPGQRVFVKNPRENLAGSVERMPFYRKATGRMPIDGFLS